MATLLVVLAVLAGILGVSRLSEATLGVGILAGACLLGILARVAQADEQHNKLTNLLVEMWKGMGRR